MKLRHALLVAALVAAFAPSAAQAEHCASDVIIFSGVKGGPKLNSNVVACAVDEAHETPYDGRIINPGSNEISARYGVDLGEGTPTLTGTLSGLGYADFEVTLTRALHATGSWVYNSAPLPLDASLSGCITLTVDVDGEAHANSFHTVGSSC